MFSVCVCVGVCVRRRTNVNNSEEIDSTLAIRVLFVLIKLSLWMSDGPNGFCRRLLLVTTNRQY